MRIYLLCVIIVIQGIKSKEDLWSTWQSPHQTTNCLLNLNINNVMIWSRICQNFVLANDGCLHCTGSLHLFQSRSKSHQLLVQICFQNWVNWMMPWEILLTISLVLIIISLLIPHHCWIEDIKLGESFLSSSSYMEAPGIVWWLSQMTLPIMS